MGYVDIASAKKMIKSLPFEHNVGWEDVGREIGHYQGWNQGRRPEYEREEEKDEADGWNAKVIICFTLNINFIGAVSIGQISLSAILCRHHLRWLESPLVCNLELNKSEISTKKFEGTPPL